MLQQGNYDNCHVIYVSRSGFIFIKKFSVVSDHEFLCLFVENWPYAVGVPWNMYDYSVCQEVWRLDGIWKVTKTRDFFPPLSKILHILTPYFCGLFYIIDIY
jgi:hypothetical protein